MSEFSSHEFLLVGTMGQRQGSVSSSWGVDLDKQQYHGGEVSGRVALCRSVALGVKLAFNSKSG